jgi:hypothetical protein
LLIRSQCPGPAQGGGCRRRPAAETPSRGPPGAGPGPCPPPGAGRRRRGPAGMQQQQLEQLRRRSWLPCPHCCRPSACRRGCAGRSCCCARGSLSTRPARRTRPRTRSAAARPRGGSGGRCPDRGGRRPSLRLTISSLPCWKGRLDPLLRVALLASRGGAPG